MKKVLSLFLALALLCSLSAFAFADDDLLNYKWEHVEKILQDNFGSDATVWPLEQVNATIWLPNAYYSVDPAELELDSCIAFFTTESGSDYILVNYADSEGLPLEGYYAYYYQDGQEVYNILVNDIPAVEQDMEDTFAVTFQTRDAKYLQFIFAPSTNPLYGYILCSIQPTDQAEEVVEEVVEAEPPAPVNPVSGLIHK